MFDPFPIDQFRQVQIVASDHIEATSRLTSTYNMDIGPFSSDRVVFVVVAAGDQDGSVTPTSLTINGVTNTDEVIRVEHATGDTEFVIWRATGLPGESANVRINWASADTDGNVLLTLAVTGLVDPETLVDSNTNIGALTNDYTYTGIHKHSVDARPNDFIIAVAIQEGVSSNVIEWREYVGESNSSITANSANQAASLRNLNAALENYTQQTPHLDGYKWTIAAGTTKDYYTSSPTANDNVFFADFLEADPSSASWSSAVVVLR